MPRERRDEQRQRNQERRRPVHRLEDASLGPGDELPCQARRGNDHRDRKHRHDNPARHESVNCQCGNAYRKLRPQSMPLPQPERDDAAAKHQSPAQRRRARLLPVKPGPRGQERERQRQQRAADQRRRQIAIAQTHDRNSRQRHEHEPRPDRESVLMPLGREDAPGVRRKTQLPRNAPQHDRSSKHQLAKHQPACDPLIDGHKCRRK